MSNLVAEETMKLVVAGMPEVRRSMRKNGRWILGLLVLVALYVLIAAAAVRAVEPWSYLRALYFTVINMTTVGFGDVVPGSHAGKIIAGLNAFAGLVLFGLIVAVVSFALQPESMTVEMTGRRSLPNPNHDGVRKPTDRDMVLDLIRALTSMVEPREGDQHSEKTADIFMTAMIHRNERHAHIHIEVSLG